MYLKRCHLRLCTIFLTLFFLATAPSVEAQTILNLDKLDGKQHGYTILGDADYRAGHGVAGAGDVDGDGFDDYPWDSSGVRITDNQ